MTTAGARKPFIRYTKTAILAAAIIGLAAFIFPSASRSAQQANPAAQVPRFLANTRVVLIDVLVTDGKGNPVRGLERGDFTLTDEGHAQNIISFEEHRRETAQEVQPPFALRPDVHTNWVSSPSNGAVNIIVFDMLNSLPADRAYGREQLIKLLKDLPPGEQVALFTLNTRLRMVQDFTTKSDTLIRAAEKMSTGSGPLSAVEFADLIKEDAKPGPGIASSGDTRTAPIQVKPGASTSINIGHPNRSVLSPAQETKPAQDLYAAMMDTRVAYTLDAFRDLAKATASLPGRKNVLWLTTGFPVKLDGTLMIGNRPSQVLRDRDYTDNIRTAAAALASSQIAIFPVDMMGMVAPIQLSPSGANWVERKPLERFDERATLQTIAEETGGRAYLDRNDLGSGIREVLTKGSDYYTLAYSPRNIKWDGSYHKVSVKLARKNVEVTYRRGYHALGEAPLTTQQASSTLGEALSVEVIDSRMIVLATQVVQPEAPGQPTKIKCSIDPNTVALVTAADGSRSATLAIGATAWDAEKHRAADVAKKVEVELKPEQWAKVTTSGIPWNLELALEPGAYTLKVAVVDLTSGKSGSVTAPLTVEVKKKQAVTPAEVRPAAAVIAPTAAPEESVPVPPIAPVDPDAPLIADHCSRLAMDNARPEALRSICEFSLSVQQKLPNYICDQKLTRWPPIGPKFPEIVEAQVAFEDGRESYSNIRINGKPSATMESPDIPNITSAGEFGSQLRHLFAPENKARFKFKKELTLNNRPALLFSFELSEDDNRSFKVWDIDGTKTHPGYDGSMWVDKTTLRPLRLQMVSKRPRFRNLFQDVKFETEYREVALADGSTFLLPSKASVNACTRSLCFRNDLEFSNWHKFRATGKMVVVP